MYFVLYPLNLIHTKTIACTLLCIESYRNTSFNVPATYMHIHHYYIHVLVFVFFILLNRIQSVINMSYM